MEPVLATIRSGRPGVVLGMALALATSAIGCTRQAGPTAPTTVESASTAAATRREPPPPLPSVSSPAARANVVVSSFEMVFDGMSSGWFVYRPSVELKEVGGVSSARITALWFLAGGGYPLSLVVDGPVGRGCLLTEESRVIPAGGTWTTAQVYLYCLDPSAPTDARGMQGSFTMHYVDEDGSLGVVSGGTTIR